MTRVRTIVTADDLAAPGDPILTAIKRAIKKTFPGSADHAVSRWLVTFTTEDGTRMRASLPTRIVQWALLRERGVPVRPTIFLLAVHEVPAEVAAA